MNKKMPMMMVMLVIVIAAMLYAWQGISMHNEVDVQETAFHELQDSYFSLDKATRDSAPTNSELSKDLVEIQQYPSTLLQLKLVGVGKILTGIFFLLFGILIALISMPVRLGMIIKEDK